MIDALPLLLGPEGYQISRSVRLRSSASAFFNNATTRTITPGAFTVSFWVKRGSLGVQQTIFNAEDGSGASAKFAILQFNSDDTLRWYHWTGSDADAAKSNGVLRDPAAWYHVVISKPAGTVGTLYLNGVAQTKQTTAANDTDIFAVTKFIGRRYDGTRSFDGYVTEFNTIDGQALTPASFGETDAVTGVWKPKKYAGTYGTNGFFLNFSDNSAATAAAIGKDSSGNSNNFTPNNISVTAGATYDSMLDVPTQWADGGNGRGNYCVINPLSAALNGGTISWANLRTFGAAAGGASIAYGSFTLDAGKWYFEVFADSNGGFGQVSVGFEQGYYFWVGNGGTYSSYGWYAVAVDFDAGKIWVKNTAGNWVSGNPETGASPSFTFTPNTPLRPACFTSRTAGSNNAGYGEWNFGQQPYNFTPPTGFKALNTLNLPTPTILKGNQYFDATTYTGTGATQSIVNSGAMQPDLVWIKDRSFAASSNLLDSIRGPRIHLESNTTNAETTEAAGVGLTAFNSNGFSLGTDNAGAGRVNFNGDTFVGWQWKEGATQGFDIVTYTGNGTSQNISHSLGVAPRMMIVKKRSTTGNWPVYHASLGNATSPFLNLTNAANSQPNLWNSTTPTSSVFTVGNDGETNANAATYVAYLFAAVSGFSSAFSYTGNGSADGTFVFLGFRPRFVMIKRTNAVDNWAIFDTSRLGYNADNNELQANTSSAEGTADFIDILSNGFKNRNSDSRCNASGGTYIGFAMAENPFKFSLGR